MRDILDGIPAGMAELVDAPDSKSGVGDNVRVRAPLPASPCGTVPSMTEQPITEEARREAEIHIQEHALGEAERIAKLSRIREVVLGAQDGLLVPLGVVTGMAAANPSQSLIIVAGLAEALAGAIAMGSGSYLASEAEEGLYQAEIRDEGDEVVEHREREIAELAIILEQEGLPREDAEHVALGLAANDNVFLRTKIQKELDLSPDAGGEALGDAFVVGGTYLVAAIIPLWPYLFFDISTALPISIVCTLVALFALGVAKGRVARLSLLRAGIKVAVIGTVSAAIGFAVGHLVTQYFG